MGPQIILAALQQFGKINKLYKMQDNIMEYMSLSRTFQDQLEKENGHPREQKQLHAVIIGRGTWDIINSLQHFHK